MAIDIIGDVRTAMADASTVGGVCANHPSTSEPIVVYGTIAEGSTGLPAISFRGNGRNTGVGAAVRTRFFIVNCYAATGKASDSLADAVEDLFRDADFETFECHAQVIGASVPDPSGDAYNTPVSLRVSYLGG